VDTNQNNNSKTFIWIGAVVVSLLAGIFIGLVILGWGVWPVQWQGGDMAVLDPVVQENYLRASIDSYSVNHNDALAQSRYNSLGSNGPALLANVYNHPAALSGESILAFSKAVGVTDPATLSTSQGTTNPNQTTQPLIGRLVARPVLASLLALFCLLLISFLVVVLLVILARRKPAPKAVAPEAPDQPAGEELPQTIAADSVQPEETLETPAPPFETGSEENAWWEAKSTQAVEPPGVGPATGSIEKPLAAAGVATISLAAAMAAKSPETQPEQAPFVAESPTLPADTGIESDLSLAPTVIAAAALKPEPASAKPDATLSPGEQPTQVSEDSSIEGKEESMAELLAKFKRDVVYIEGVGEAYGKKLKDAGVPNVGVLLEKGATPKGREEIAAKSGISHTLILKWVNHVDLYRIRGVGSEYAELLEVSGVDTVVELSKRVPQHLFDKMVAVNQEKKLVRRIPLLSQVENWVEQAKKLPRVVSY